MEIRAERVVLRRLRADDAPAIVAGCSDPDVPRFIPFVPQPYEEKDAVTFLREVDRRWASDDVERNLAIADPGTDDLLGVVTVRLREGGEVGYWLQAAARGSGLMTEAVNAIVRWAVEEHGIRRLTLTAHPDNLASQRVAEKAGFVQIGLVPHQPPFRDGTAVAVAFELDTAPVSDRLAVRVRSDFGAEAERLLDRLASVELPLAERQSRERIQAAIVLSAAGDLGAFDYAMRLASRDWRDVLMGAGLGNLDWTARLDAELGPR
jgi:RimJ/RimL family protein N-acetyltransferase